MPGLLNRIFEEYRGFKEVRYVKERGLAFIEYEQDVQADAAMKVVKQR